MNKNFLQTGISITLMLIGVTFVLGAALFGARFVLSASLVSDPIYLESTIVPTFDLPAGLMEAGPISSGPQDGIGSGPQDGIGALDEQTGEAQLAPPSKEAQQENAPGDLAFPIAGIPSMVESPLDAANLLPSYPLQAATATAQGRAQDSAESTPETQPETSPEHASGQDSIPAPLQPATNAGADTPPQDESQPQSTETVTEPEGQPEEEQGSQPEDQTNTDETANEEGGQDSSEQPPPEENDAAAPPERPEAQPAVRLKIPKLRVERAIVPVGWNRNGWNTDPLFATRNRPDLVGHLEGSALPGEGGNIVLVGHNFDWGIYQWYGVFSNLKSLRPGDKIKLYGKGGEEHIYFVEKVKEIPYSNGKKDDMSRHYKFIGLKNKETLTLVTCGGANFWFWNKRVYVVARPDE